jgi:hypothetical protein
VCLRRCSLEPCGQFAASLSAGGGERFRIKRESLCRMEAPDEPEHDDYDEYET